MTPTIQYSGPRVSAVVDPEVRRHLQIIYQKLGNHAQGFELQNQKIDALEPSAGTANTTTVTTVPGGGTGTQSFPVDAVLLGNGASPFLIAPPVQAGFALTDNGPGVAPTFQAIVQSFTFVTLPATPAVGQIVVVTDSMVNTWGTAITVGGGTDQVLAWWNGTDWTVIGI